MKQHATRRRGVFLTSRGLQRLQAAISALEMVKNNGNNFTLEQLSDRIPISTKTLSRLWSLNAGVDQKTLKICFSAFDLELCSDDYTISSESDVAETRVPLSTRSGTKEISSLQSKASGCLQEKFDPLEYICSYPDGPVAPDSALYIERPPLENLAEQEITQPGCVIRIRAPRDMGKTSLVLRLTAFAQQQEYYTVKVEFRQIDRLCLSDLNHFLHYFCWRIAKELGIKPNSDDNWDEEIGSNVSCFLSIKNNLFAQINSSLVLVLEQVDCLFEYPQIAQEFFLLLRSCYEEAQQDTNWLETQTSSSLLYRSNGLYRHKPLPIQYWITITFERIYYSARREKKMMRFRQTLLLIMASANIAFLGIAGHIQLLQADAQIPRRAVPNPPEKNPKPVMFFNRHLKLL